MMTSSTIVIILCGLSAGLALGLVYKALRLAKLLEMQVELQRRDMVKHTLVGQNAERGHPLHRSQTQQTPQKTRTERRADTELGNHLRRLLRKPTRSNRHAAQYRVWQTRFGQTSRRDEG
jgi:hypothetical protein